ncbi:hypothetical protein PLESTF_001023900 [Pleodorina starrii]|nr:hypothetical protein PLESTF_001023900 [Pleodorina starrii]
MRRDCEGPTFGISLTVGSLLKRWLEELPDPLLNWDQQVELLSACKDEGCIEARIASLNDAVSLVDQISLGTLKPLLLFLQQYCFRQRRFDQQLLQVAVAFAPILFPAALAAGPAELRLAEETVATLVSNALHVFNPTLAANVPVVTPQALCEAAAEIMESQQQQQPGDSECLGCAGVAGSSPPHEHHHQGAHVSAPSSLDQQQQEQPLLKQEEQTADVPAYEPYLQDVPFLASLHDMVNCCVAGALFSFDDPAEAAETPGCCWGADDDCGSMHSSCSNINLSGGGAASCGGAASSGGASSCSGASMTLSQGELFHPPQHLSHHHHQHHHHQHQHQHHQHYGSTSTTHATCRRSANEGGGAQQDAPYSPRAVLVALPLSTSDAAGSLQADGPAKAAVKAAPAPVSPAALAELAQREVSEGNLFCIISAQPGGGPVTLTAAAASSGGGNCVSAEAGKKAAGDAPATTFSLPAADVAELQAVMFGAQQYDPPSSARSARRPTEGGAAAATAGEPCTTGSRSHGHGQEQQVGGGLRPASRISAAGLPVEPRQRRMTMGGGDGGHAAASPSTQQQQNAVGSAVAALYQHLPQLRNRVTGSSGGCSGSSGGGGTSPHSSDRDRLPPPAATSPSSSLHGGGGIGSCIAELGVAGHLRVNLTGSLTLLVRELNTPEAMAHRVPIRSMSSAAMQAEKERLKRQLKDVAAAYEGLAGRSLTQALKEPLRPVYVRYHKIKALLSSGKAGTGQVGVAAGVGGSVASGRAAQQRPAAALVSSRPSVLA